MGLHWGCGPADRALRALVVAADLNRSQQLPPEKAGLQAALVVLAGAVGSVALGAVVDRAGLRRPNGQFIAVASLSILTAIVLVFVTRTARQEQARNRALDARAATLISAVAYDWERSNSSTSLCRSGSPPQASMRNAARCAGARERAA